MPMFLLSAQIRDPTQNTPTVINKIGLRPQISEILPHMGAVAAFASRYADPIHVYPVVLLNSWEIVGMATVTMVTSSAARKSALERAAMMAVVWRLVRPSSGAPPLDGWASVGGSLGGAVGSPFSFALSISCSCSCSDDSSLASWELLKLFWTVLSELLPLSEAALAEVGGPRLVPFSAADAMSHSR